MAKLKAILIGVSILLALTCIPISECVKKPVSRARREDVPYIKCQVCEKLAAQLCHQVQKKQAEIAPKKISEYQIIEITENVCNLKKAEADWILQIDIVEKGDKLELVEQGTEGQCNSECKTIERACQEVMGYSDTDVAEFLYKSQPQIDSLANYLCKDLTKACSTKPPPVPKEKLPSVFICFTFVVQHRTPGEPFVAKPAKEAEMEKILKSMESMPGAPGMKMYSRDDLMNMKKFGDEDADDDDDEDEETSFPSKLGKVLREKESYKDDWKQKITKGIAKTVDTLKIHGNKVSNRVRQWWGKIKKPSPKKSSKQEL